MAWPKIFLSGRFSTGKEIEAEWLRVTGCKHRCFSFANVDKRAVWFNQRVTDALGVCEKNKIEIMMDSGAHSFHRFAEQSKRRSEKARNKQEINLEDLRDLMFSWYTKYCLVNKKKWDFYITLDYKRHQPTIFDMQLKFEAVGLRPVPVFHGDESLDWVMKYYDKGYDLICIGSSRELRGKGWKGYRYYLDRLFELGAKHNIRYHGLAATSLSIMSSYPWYSVDSSTWSKVACFGCINFPDRDRNIIYNLHISSRATRSEIASYNNFPKNQREQVEATLKELGYDLKALRTGKDAINQRHNFNGMVFSSLDKLGIDFNKQAEKKVRWERLV